MGISMNHLSLDEIDRITDTSDLSPEYLNWYEGVEEHVADCVLCREQIRRKILCDDLSDGNTLKIGLRMLEKEEEIRKNMVIAKQMQQGMINRKIVTPNRAMHNTAAYMQGMTLPEEVFEREEYGNRKNDIRIVLEKTKDSEARKTNESRDDDA